MWNVEGDEGLKFGGGRPGGIRALVGDPAHSWIQCYCLLSVEELDEGSLPPSK